jgi:hypothetical protein
VAPTPGEAVLHPGKYFQWSASRAEAPKIDKKIAKKGGKTELVSGTSSLTGNVLMGR